MRSGIIRTISITGLQNHGTNTTSAVRRHPAITASGGYFRSKECPDKWHTENDGCACEIRFVFTPREFFSDSKAFGNPIGSLSRRITGQE